MSNPIRSLWSWLAALTESQRAWLSWKIFPEQVFYMDVVKRVGELDENNRIVKLFLDSDSACAAWAAEEARIKNVAMELMLKDLEEKYGEVPF
jgi:hypothetical protein